MIYTIDHMLTGCKHGINVTCLAYPVGAEVAFIVRPHRTEAPPVILRMYKDGIILCLAEIQNRLQYLIFDLHQLHCPAHRFLRRTRHDCRSIPDEAHPLIQDQPVIGTGLRIGLTCHRKPLVRQSL